MNRWTVRPAISKENVKGYGVEIPVDTGLSNAFMKELRESELEDIHNYIGTQYMHFHLTVDSLECCISLAKSRGYYF